MSSLYNAAWTLGLVNPSARLCELRTNPILLISRALYACLAAYMSSMIRFSLVRLPLDMMSKRLLESVSMCTGIGSFNMNSSCLRIARASSDRSANAMTSADSTERAMRLDLYDLYDIGIALLAASVRRTMRPSCEDKSALLAKAASLYATIRSESKSNLGIRIDALLS